MAAITEIAHSLPMSAFEDRFRANQTLEPTWLWDRF